MMLQMESVLVRRLTSGTQLSALFFGPRIQYVLENESGHRLAAITESRCGDPKEITVVDSLYRCQRRTEVFEDRTGALAASISYFAGITIQGQDRFRVRFPKAPRPQVRTMEVVDADKRPIICVAFENGSQWKLRPFALGRAVIRDREVDNGMILVTVLAFQMLSVKLSPGPLF
jgi:hypothetical protein